MAESNKQRAVEMAREAASTVSQAATGMISSAAAGAESATGAVASGMRSVAGNIREHAPHGMLGTAAGTVADTLDKSGRYLQREGLRGLAHDAVDIARRNPVACMLTCFGIGCCVGAFLTLATSKPRNS